MKLYLARHGESEGNRKRLFYGWTDYPLTDLGYEQALLIGEKLFDAQIKRCYASPLVRAADTARLCMQKRDIPITTLDDLKEQYMGDLEDTSLEENLINHPDLIRAMLKDWKKVAPPGGESYETLSRRVLACLDGIIAAGEDALIVAHNGTLSTMISWILETPIGSIDKFWFEHGCYSCLSFTEGRVRLECFNK